MKIDIVRECPLIQSPRVIQVSGMFDVSLGDKSRVVIKGDLPIEEREWNVGLIVGPSGSGKSTVATEIFGDKLITGFEWPADRSILDGFPEKVGIKTVTGLLNSVGFGSTPNWLRPYRVLSNGEQFRATVARALAETSDLVVIDEFTSVVDRQVAKVASHCVQKAVRRAKRRLIAVACHYDIIEWLQPDWVYEPHLGAFEWRSLQRRPEIALELRAVGRDVWDRFSKYHYLSADLNPGSLCVGAFIEGQCVGFCGISKFPHPLVRNIFNESRTVVLPDYQGLGISRAMTEWIGLHLWERGWRFHSVTTHPAIVAQKAGSPRWKLHRHGVMGANKSDNRGIGFTKHARNFTARRIAANFSYTAPAGTLSPGSPERSGPLFEGSLELATAQRAAARGRKRR